MKKTMVAVVLAGIFLVPALLAQGTAIRPFDPGSGKLKIVGMVSWYEMERCVSSVITLTYNDRRVVNAKVWLNDWPLQFNGGQGQYQCIINKHVPRLGDRLELSVEIPAPMIGVKPPFTGRKVLATYVVDNLIEWIFPTSGAMIDLSSYPGGHVPFRWNFTGATTRALLELTNLTTGSIVFNAALEAETYAVPVSYMAPGNRYRVALDNSLTGFPPMGEFKMSKLAALGSKIDFTQDSFCDFSTRTAK